MIGFFDLSVVLPNYNDILSLEPFLHDVDETLSSTNMTYELIIVDDGSTDQSCGRLQELISHFQNLKVVQLKRNFGQQSALYVGLVHSKGDVVITIDGDGQYPAKILPQFVSAIKTGYDIASGVREMRQDTLVTRLTSSIGGWFIRKILNFDIQDFGSVKAFSRDLVNRIISVQVGSFDVYPAALSWHPKIKEIDIDHVERKIGTSKWNLSKRLKLFFDLYFKYGSDEFGLVFKSGGMMIFLSCAVTFLWLSYKFVFGHQESVLLILFLGFLGMCFGIALLFFSMLASVLKQILRMGTQKPEFMIADIHHSQSTETEKRLAG